MNLSKKILTLMAATSVASMADVCTLIDNVYNCNIGNAADFSELAALVNSNDANRTFDVKLTADVDLSSYVSESWIPIGSEDYPFQGVFDGQNHTISNLKYEKPSKDNVGLFGVAKVMDAKDVGLVNFNLSGSNNVGALIGRVVSGGSLDLTNVYNSGSEILGDAAVGGLVGRAYTNYNIVSCYNTGIVEGISAGGLIGILSGSGVSGSGYIRNSYNMGAVGTRTAGGLVGVVGDDAPTSTNLAIENSYNVGSVDGNAYAGGLVGRGNVGVLANSYNKGAIAGDTAGGFLGKGACTQGLRNSYNLGSVTGVTKAGGFTGEGWMNVSDSYNAGIVTSNGQKGEISTNGVNTTNTYCIGNGQNCIQKSEEEFTNGTVAGLLSSGSETVWTTGTDGYPVLVGVGGQENAPGEKEIVTLDGASGEPLVITEEQEVDGIVLKREFTPNSVATIMLPFTIAVEKVTNAKFYNFSKATRVDGRWKVTMTREKSQVLANTPYAVFVDGTEMAFEEGTKVTLVPNTPSSNSVTKHSEDGNPDYWSFIGTYERVDVEDGNSTDGWNYCYAAQAQEEDGIKKGQFVYMGSGARVDPMRAYLKRIPDATYEPAPRALMKPAAVSSINSIPFEIGVEFIDEEEGTMAIGTINTITGEIKADRWFDMKGRKLDHKPTTKGTYYNNRTKVIIK